MKSILPAFTSRFIYRVCTRCNINASIYCPILYAPCARILTNTNNVGRNHAGRLLCSGSGEQKHKERVKEELRLYLKQHRVRLRDTEQRIKETGSGIIKDIKETKDKVKVRVGEIIEVSSEDLRCKVVTVFFKFILEGKCVHNTKFLMCLQNIVVALSWNVDY